MGRVKHLFTDKIYCLHLVPQEPELACSVVEGRLKIRFLKEKVKSDEQMVPEVVCRQRALSTYRSTGNFNKSNPGNELSACCHGPFC